MQFERIPNIYLSTILQVPLVAPVRQERRAFFLASTARSLRRSTVHGLPILQARRRPLCSQCAAVADLKKILEKLRASSKATGGTGSADSTRQGQDLQVIGVVQATQLTGSSTNASASVTPDQY